MDVRVEGPSILEDDVSKALLKVEIHRHKANSLDVAASLTFLK